MDYVFYIDHIMNEKHDLMRYLNVNHFSDFASVFIIEHIQGDDLSSIMRIRIQI